MWGMHWSTTEELSLQFQKIQPPFFLKQNEKARTYRIIIVGRIPTDHMRGSHTYGISSRGHQLSRHAPEPSPYEEKPTHCRIAVQASAGASIHHLVLYSWNCYYTQIVMYAAHNSQADGRRFRRGNGPAILWGPLTTNRLVGCSSHFQIRLQSYAHSSLGSKPH